MNKMIYWILSAALVASALGEPCNLPGRWMLLCTPTLITDNTNWNSIPTRIQPQNPTFVKPDDCEHSKPVVTTTVAPKPTKVIETTNIDTDFGTLFGGLLEIFGKSGNKVAPTTTTTTTTTTTAAPEIKTRKNGMTIVTETLGGLSGMTPKQAPREIKGEVTPEIAIWIKYLSENPKLMGEISTFLANASKNKNRIIETRQTVPKFELPIQPPVKYSPPIVRYTPPSVPSTPAPVPEQPTLIETSSGPFVSGHSFEHKSEQSSQSNVQTIRHYSYENQGPIRGYEITSEKEFNVPANPSVKVPSGELTQEVSEFVTSKPTVISQNPCDFATGIFRFVPCENLIGNNKFVVEKTLPMTKSFESYSFDGPYGFQNVNTNYEIKNSVDC